MRIKTSSPSEFLRGGSHPGALLLAVVLGTLLGFTTGAHLTCAGLLLAALLINVRTRAMLTCWAVFFSASWWCQPLIAHIGRLALDETPLGALLGRIGGGTLVALLGWDQYVVVGGLLTGLALSIPVAKLVAVWKLHRQETPDTAPELEASLTRWNPLRPGALLVCGALLLLSGPIVATVAPAYLEHRLLVELSDVNQAEVTAGEVSLGWFDGKLSMSDVRFSDPQRLGSDRLQIAQLTGQIHVGGLLRGYLEIDELQLDEVRPGGAVGYETSQPPNFASHEGQVHAKPARFSAEPGQLRLEDYVANWPRCATGLQSLAQLVRQVEELSCDQHDCGCCLAGREAGRRSALGHAQPRWQIRSLRAEHLNRAWGAGNRALVEMANLSSDPKSTIRPTTLKLIAPELGTEIEATLSLRGSRPRHEVAFRSFDLSLAQLLDEAQPDASVIARGGVLALRGAGWVDREHLHVNVQLEATELDAHCAGNATLAGLQPETWNEGLRRLNGLRADALLCGTWQEPRLEFNAPQLVSQFKHQLRAARQHNLVRAIEAELASAEQLATRRPASTTSQPATEARDAPQAVTSTPTTRDTAHAQAPADRYASESTATTRARRQPDRYADYRPAAPANTPAAAAQTPRDAATGRLYEKMVQQDVATPATENVCDGCTSSPDEELPQDEPGTPIGYPSTELANTEYPTTDTPYAAATLAANPATAPAQSAVAELPVGPTYTAQPTSMTGPYGGTLTAPPLPGPVDMQTGYDPMRIDQIIESQSTAPPTSVAIEPAAPSSPAEAIEIVTEGAKFDVATDTTVEPTVDEPPSESRFTRWRQNLVSGAKQLWPFGRRTPAEEITDPWAAEIAASSAESATTDDWLAESPTPDEPVSVDDYIAEETTLGDDVTLEASKPSSPTNRFQFWRNWR